MTTMRLSILLLLTCCGVLRGQGYAGYISSISCAGINGTAYNTSQPNTPIYVDIYDGTSYLIP